MVPVMLWRIAISGHCPPFSDWVVAGCVTFGLFEFLMMGPVDAPTGSHDSTKGFALLLLFLTFDGLTSTFQEKLFKDHGASKFNQMFYINACSLFVCLAALIVFGKLFYCL